MSKQLLSYKDKPVYSRDGGFTCDVTESLVSDNRDNAGNYTYSATNAYNAECFNLVSTMLGHPECTTPAQLAEHLTDEQCKMVSDIISPSAHVRTTRYDDQSPQALCTFREVQSIVIAEKQGDLLSENFATAVLNLCKAANVPTAALPKRFPRLKCNGVKFIGITKSARDIDTQKTSTNYTDLLKSFGLQPIVQKRKTKRQLTEDEIGKLTTDQVKAYVGAKFTALANGNPNKATYDYLATLEVEVEETV